MQKANKNEVRKEIADLINRIKEQSDRIGMQREIPQSELDLILHRIEELHRRTIVWSYLNELPEEVHTPPPVVPVTPPVASPLPPVVPQEMTTEQVERNKEQAEKYEVASDPEPVVKNNPVTEQKMPQTPEPPKQPEPEKVPVPKTEQPVQPPVQKAELPVTKQLKDVKTFIGFNEKLMYIRQVFKGDSAAYDAAIVQFNSISSWDEAQAFLSVLAEEYKWSKHDEPVEIFTQTVKRRFS